MKHSIQCHVTDCDFNCDGECVHSDEEIVVNVQGKCVSYEETTTEEEESVPRRVEKGTGSIGAEMVRRMIAQYEGHQGW